ncbi:MAG: hypothetical protein MUC38_04865 [Cyclobacteriaceae bacterium]|jgi:hypothetical protein|nr:hypothetical protein [Cyclobacteriaceae bacterium]
MKNLLTAAFVLVFTVSCNDEMAIPPETAQVSDLKEKFANTTMLSDVIAKSSEFSSIAVLSQYLETTYGVRDFNRTYEQILPYFANHRADSYVRTSSTEVDILSLDTMFGNANIPLNSASYDFVLSLDNIFANETISDDQVVSEIQNLKNSIILNGSIGQPDRERLSLISDMVMMNYYDISQVASTIAVQNTAMSRTQGWLSRAWRIVRSVVLTVVSTAIIGGAVGFVAGGPIGAIVGAIVGAVGGGFLSIRAIRSDDTCHFAFQCGENQEQSCTTGACMPE